MENELTIADTEYKSTSRPICEPLPVDLFDVLFILTGEDAIPMIDFNPDDIKYWKA